MGIRITLFTDRARIARQMVERNLRAWVIGTAAVVAAIAYLWACWHSAPVPPVIVPNHPY